MVPTGKTIVMLVDTIGANVMKLGGGSAEECMRITRGVPSTAPYANRATGESRP